MIKQTSWKTKVISAFTSFVMLFMVFSAPVSALDLSLDALKDKAISVLRGQAEKAITYGNYAQKLLKLNTFQNEAEKRAYYQNKELAVKNKIQLKTQNVYNKYDSLVTKNVNKVITPDSHWSLQFVGGALEGIPKGILELGVLGYNVYERGKTGNLYATSVNTYYKLKDNQDTYKELGSYIVSHPLQAGGAVAGALFNEGKNYALSLYHNPRAAGNLVGSIAGVGGLLGAAGKGLKAVNKGLPAATRALETVSTIRVPAMGATPVAVGTAAKASKLKYFSATTFPKLTVNTKTIPLPKVAAEKDILGDAAISSVKPLTTRNKAFRDAKEAAGIPKSLTFTKHKLVIDPKTENRLVYEFNLDGVKKYIVEHFGSKYDARGPHFHISEGVKGSLQKTPLDLGRYLQSAKHFPEDIRGYKK